MAQSGVTCCIFQANKKRSVCLHPNDVTPPETRFLMSHAGNDASQETHHGAKYNELLQVSRAVWYYHDSVLTWMRTEQIIHYTLHNSFRKDEWYVFRMLECGVLSRQMVTLMMNIDVNISQTVRTFIFIISCWQTACYQRHLPIVGTQSIKNVSVNSTCYMILLIRKSKHFWSVFC